MTLRSHYLLPRLVEAAHRLHPHLEATDLLHCRFCDIKMHAAAASLNEAGWLHCPRCSSRELEWPNDAGKPLYVRPVIVEDSDARPV